MKLGDDGSAPVYKAPASEFERYLWRSEQK